MNRLKRNIIIIIIILLILAGIGLFLNSMTETVEFEEFSIEAPLRSSFYSMTPDNDNTIKEMYRCSNEDLTITSFNKEYIEETYYNDTGERFDFAEGMLNNISAGNSETSKINENITRIILTSDIDGYADTDVACIYHDDNHVIIIEGGDVDLITRTAESIKILY